jgi:Leucine-rich repeat (LRR) protein
MDIDTLEQYSEMAMNSILAQDVTDYSSIVTPKTVLNVLYSATPQGQLEQDACYSITGPVEFGRHTYKIFQWLQKSKAISQPRVNLEPRKPRKEAAPGGSTTANNTTTANQTAAAGSTTAALLLRSQAHRNANLSKMSIAYSNSKSIVTVLDECFLEDGKLAIVDRSVTVAPLPAEADAAAQEAHAAEVASFLGLSKSRIDTNNSKPPILDFTFCDLTDLYDLMRKKPASGRAHVFRPIAVQKEGDAGKSANLLLPEFNKANKALIKAKNKKGEEEVYEFDLDAHGIKDKDQGKGGKGGAEEEDVLAKLAGAMNFKYQCEAVRLCNNSIADLTQLVPVLRSVVANYFLSLHWIDLSSNNITTLCDLSSLPLTTLYLHANRISDWSEVDKWVCNLPLLQSITMFGNPIATSSDSYKQEMLRRLFGVPGKPVRQLDFVALSSQDLHVSGMYDLFHKGKGVVLSKAMEVSKRGGSLSPRKQQQQGENVDGSTPRKGLSKSSPRR